MIYERTRLENAKAEADMWASRLGRRRPLSSDARVANYSQHLDRYDAAARAARWRAKYGEDQQQQPRRLGCRSREGMTVAMMITCRICKGAFCGDATDTLCAMCEPTPEELLRRYRRALERIRDEVHFNAGGVLMGIGPDPVKIAGAVLAGEDPDGVK